MKENEIFRVGLDHIEDYQFQATFRDLPGIRVTTDEDPPLGQNSGPNAARLLAVSIGYCLSASLLFCLGKSHITVRDLETQVAGEVVRNENGRLRIGNIQVEMDLDFDAEEKERAVRCLGLFEDYCTVTATLRKAIHIDVIIREMLTGQTLFTHKTSEQFAIV